VPAGISYDKLGHFNRSPSSQRMYISSEMGDFFGIASSTFADSMVDGKPEMSSWTSVTTRPLAVISLFRMMRLWGNKPRAVCTCCRTEVLLEGI
jgi:hypothetical protein